MRVLSSVLVASTSLLAMSSCVRDYAPDPTDELDTFTATDGGAQVDASRELPVTDARVRSRPDAAALFAAARGPCDLSGHYLITERLSADYIGVHQVAYNWYYVELQQTGNQLKFARSTSCGGDVEGRPFVNVGIYDQDAWPSYLTEPAYTGRMGWVAPVAEGCSVRVDQGVVVHGAPTDAYRDLSTPLPTLDQPASAGSAGWQDTDGDGRPGVSLYIHGDAQGVIYAVTRTWTAYDGTIADGADNFTLGLDWGQSRSTLGPAGFVFNFDAVRSPDTTPQIVEFTRLTDDEWAGDDATRCERLRTLAPTLTPRASE